MGEIFASPEHHGARGPNRVPCGNTLPQHPATPLYEKGTNIPESAHEAWRSSRVGRDGVDTLTPNALPRTATLLTCTPHPAPQAGLPRLAVCVAALDAPPRAVPPEARPLHGHACLMDMVHVPDARVRGPILNLLMDRWGLGT